MTLSIPSQKTMNNSIKSIPVEYFKWGTYPDHFKIEMPHRHQFGELLFFVKGGGVHEIDYKDYEVHSYSIHYIPKATTHFLKRDIQSDGFTISFDTEFFEKNTIHRFLNPLKLDPFVLNLTETRFQVILDQTKQILYQIKQNKGYYREKCFLISMELMMNTLASIQKENLSPTNNTNQLVRSFKYLVKTHSHNHHLVSWYANELHVSTKYLGNQVKQELDVSAKQYIVNQIIRSVKKELLDSNKSIKQIAFDYGYDMSSLGKLFKKSVGFSMTDYRSNVD